MMAPDLFFHRGRDHDGPGLYTFFSVRKADIGCPVYACDPRCRGHDIGSAGHVVEECQLAEVLRGLARGPYEQIMLGGA